MSVKIKKLCLSDFRAFPGPAVATFELSGKNLLVYGENGAGKSSIFHALKGFFSFQPHHPLDFFKNIFSGVSKDHCFVRVEYNDGTQAEWRFQLSLRGTGQWEEVSPTAHPGHTQEAALRQACLDYRALLDTNYKHEEDSVDWFEIALHRLLADFPCLIDGVTKRVAALWRMIHIAIEDAKNFIPRTESDIEEEDLDPEESFDDLSEARKSEILHYLNAASLRAYQERIAQACVSFNVGFQQALVALLPRIEEMLSALLRTDLKVQPIIFGGIVYDEGTKELKRSPLRIDVAFFAHPIPKMQYFLNEARLSALGLSIYLAGRLACVPLNDDKLRLLVLDDVLIGLDHSNRLPVLRLVRDFFKEWQVVLLTHDRVWYEMARFLLEDEAWKCIEVYESIDLERGIHSPAFPLPSPWSTATDPIESQLQDADQFLMQSQPKIAAAANYARTAFELMLKHFCEKQKVPVPFCKDVKRLDTEDFFSSVEHWMSSKYLLNTSEMLTILRNVRSSRCLVLNPYSHSSPPHFSRQEIADAIASIKVLYDLLRSLIKGESPLKWFNHTSDIKVRISFLRASVCETLHKICEIHALSIPSKINLSFDRLWSACQPVLHVSNAQLASDIENDRGWLIDDVPLQRWSSLRSGDADRLKKIAAALHSFV